jgi:acyl-CoA thioesterase-1
VLEPFSLTLLIVPSDAQREAAASSQSARHAAFAPVEDDPALPRVLLIGDSISVGYTVPVQKALAGKANVHRPAANCGTTTKGLEHLSQWLGDGRWDVIHFNWGLHDLICIGDTPQTPIDEYEKNLRQLLARLKKTGATLVWCSTTPVPPGRRAPIKPEEVLRYNEVARKIMEESGIAIDDLHAFALPQLEQIQLPTNVHVTPEGSQVLAQQVARSIEAALKRRAAGQSAAAAADEISAIAKTWLVKH